MPPRPRVAPTGVERTFAPDEIIVSKTDPTGRITYANDLFLRISGYERREVLGAPHSLIRHPDMPRGVFRLMWETLGRGEELFAYVVNLCRSGDHYWVFAHVTPTFDAAGRITGYHSNRRSPDRHGVEVARQLYARMRAAEAAHDHADAACAASAAVLDAVLKERRQTYPELMFALWEGR